MQRRTTRPLASLADNDSADSAAAAATEVRPQPPLPSLGDAHFVQRSLAANAPDTSQNALAHKQPVHRRSSKKAAAAAEAVASAASSMRLHMADDHLRQAQAREAELRATVKEHVAGLEAALRVAHAERERIAASAAESERVATAAINEAKNTRESALEMSRRWQSELHERERELSSAKAQLAVNDAELTEARQRNASRGGARRRVRVAQSKSS